MARWTLPVATVKLRIGNSTVPVPGTVQYCTVRSSGNSVPNMIYSIYIYRGVTVLDSTRQVYNLGNGGSQLTVTLWMGLSQTPEIENGNGSHCHFS